jgi:cation diffusion facilitator family transporter
MTTVAARASPKVRAERVAIAAAGALAVGKLGAGIATNSIGLLSAAADSVFDVAVSSLNLLSIWIADSPADEGHPFGHGKAENLAGLLQTLIIALVGGALLVEAVRRLLRGARPEPSGGWWSWSPRRWSAG